MTIGDGIFGSVCTLCATFLLWRLGEDFQQAVDVKPGDLPGRWYVESWWP